MREKVSVLLSDAGFKIGLFSLAGVLLLILPIDFFFLRGKEVSELQGFLENILVESHGLLFDVVLFGFILKGLEVIRSRASLISRYKEEIDDFRGWNEKEAMYRIVGNIRRLNALGVTDIDLSYVYLEGAHLNSLDLTNSDLRSANLRNSSLRGVKFNGSCIEGANFSGSNVRESDFTDVVAARGGGVESMQKLLDTSKEGGAFDEFREDNDQRNRMPNMNQLVGWREALFDDRLKMYVKKSNTP